MGVMDGMMEGRETIERSGKLLTAETEANGDSRSTHERGSSVVGSMGLTCQYKRFLSCFDSSCLPSTKYLFFLHRSLFHFICPHRPGGQGAEPRRLSLNMYLCWGGGGVVG
jgi:hypothetical protein